MSGDRSPTTPLRHSRFDVAIVGVSCVVALLMVLRHGHYLTDDCFITLRYARHLVEGHGFVFNPGGERVEGFSNLSHAWLAAASIAMGIEPLGVLRFVNRAAIVLLPAVTYVLAFGVTRHRAAATGAAILVALHPALAHWSGSGLETGSFVFLVTASLAVGLSRPGRLRVPLLVVLIIAAATTRPDGIVLPAVLGAVGLHRKVTGQPSEIVADQLWQWAVPAGIGIALLFGWRLSYFGYLLPNSAYYKAGGDTEAQLVAEFVTQNLWLFVLLPFARWSVIGRRGLVLYGLVIAYFVGFYDVIPSVAALHRFFLPAFPALVILATASLTRLDVIGLNRTRATVAAGLLILGLGWADFRQVQAGDEKALKRAENLNDRMRSRFQLAVTLAETLPADAWIAIGDVGAVGYLLENPIHDAFGLNSLHFTHEHEGAHIEFIKPILAQDPDAIVVVSKERKKFERRYWTDRHLQSEKDFKKTYGRVAVVPSEAEYFYFVYLRTKGETKKYKRKFKRKGTMPNLLARAQKRIAKARKSGD
jgi:hypothetical protein